MFHGCIVASAAAANERLLSNGETKRGLRNKRCVGRNILLLMFTNPGQCLQDFLFFPCGRMQTRWRVVLHTTTVLETLASGLFGFPSPCKCSIEILWMQETAVTKMVGLFSAGYLMQWLVSLGASKLYVDTFKTWCKQTTSCVQKWPLTNRVKISLQTLGIVLSTSLQLDHTWDRPAVMHDSSSRQPNKWYWLYWQSCNINWLLIIDST